VGSVVRRSTFFSSAATAVGRILTYNASTLHHERAGFGQIIQRNAAEMNISGIDRVRYRIAFQDEGAAVRALVQADDAGNLELRKASRTAARLTPSSGELTFRRQLVAGAQRACGHLAANLFADCSNTRLVRIGANRGCDRSFAAASATLARVAAAAGFFARPASLRRSSSSWSRFRSPQCTRGCLRVHSFTNLTGMDSRTERS